MSNKTPCPMCFNSSGSTLFRGGCSQKCSDCNGKGFVSEGKHRRLQKFYGDMLPNRKESEG